MSATLWLLGSEDLSQLRLLRPGAQDQLVLCARAAEAVAEAIDRAGGQGDGEALAMLAKLECQLWTLQREEAPAETENPKALREADPKAAAAQIAPVTPAQLVQMACAAARVVSL